MLKISYDIILRNVTWQVTRSQGAGGQHVNKTNSAVIAIIDILTLEIKDEHKSLLLKKLSPKLIQGRFIQVRSEQERDQKTNKDVALKKVSFILESALYIQPKRVKTKPTKGSVERRLQSKSNKSEIKKLRREKF
ncbi:MAG: alternative ribosome rescue aminoacyl-tRNA hydrolase ArfB [Pseudobdellovibrio sp.]